jgi:hypothetical protein
MAIDEALEQGIRALLDGRELPARLQEAADAAEFNALRIVDAIARAHRTAILGSDVPLDPQSQGRWGRLDIRAEIGRGATATVYRAWDTRLAREVALKLFAPEVESEALEEGRLLARLNHPHIVRVFGADTFNGSAGIWMELLEGDTLDEILARDGVFGAEETILIGLDLARALAAVHAAGLLHRDIKSRNVLRERGGRIVLMDLGAGRIAEDSADHRDGTGTPMYMAPEVLAGGAATVQSDLYCLGVLLYRLLTGAFPVSAADLTGLRAAHAAGERQSIQALRPDLAAAVAGAVERCCHPNPAGRYESAVDVEAALTDVWTTTLARRTSVAPPFLRAWRQWRKPLAVTAAAMACAVIAAWGVWDTNPLRDARRKLGLVVPPRSTLYLSLNAAIGVVRGLDLSVQANATSAAAIAVSSDLGVLTVAGRPPWTTGGRFQLDGTPVASLPTVNQDLCCFMDGTTDGEFNYAPRWDSTLLEPVGSRPLAPPGLYRFDRDWSNPQLLFPLHAEGNYHGIAYSSASRSFWLTRKSGSLTVIEEWRRDGSHVRTPIEVPATLTGIAIDPLDDTLWVVQQQYSDLVIGLENFDREGRHLTTVYVPNGLQYPDTSLSAVGAEFAWVTGR